MACPGIGPGASPMNIGRSIKLRLTHCSSLNFVTITTLPLQSFPPFLSINYLREDSQSGRPNVLFAMAEEWATSVTISEPLHRQIFLKGIVTDISHICVATQIPQISNAGELRQGAVDQLEEFIREVSDTDSKRCLLHPKPHPGARNNTVGIWRHDHYASRTPSCNNRRCLNSSPAA